MLRCRVVRIEPGVGVDELPDGIEMDADHVDDRGEPPKSGSGSRSFTGVIVGPIRRSGRNRATSNVSGTGSSVTVTRSSAKWYVPEPSLTLSAPIP